MDKYGNKLRLIQICPGTAFQDSISEVFPAAFFRSGAFYSVSFI